MKLPSRSEVYARSYRHLEGKTRYKLHTGFINSISIDNLLHQYMLCAGADSSIRIFDLELGSSTPQHTIPAKTAHKFGVSKVQWWLEDNGMFISGSFDNTVALWDTDSMEQVYRFDLAHKVYNLDTNKDGLIATALDHPYIKLLDTRSGSESHILRGHNIKVMSVKWNPRNDTLLASAGADGTIRLWDVRQSHPLVECLDMNRTSVNKPLDPLEFRRSHRTEINGLCWSPTADRLVSMGNDNKVRLWNLTVEGGINEGMNFGPLVQNRFLQNNDPLISPESHDIDPVLFINVDSGNILMYEMNSGKLIKRLVPPSGASSSRQACLAPRRNQKVEYFSGDGEGNLIEWSPKRDSEKAMEFIKEHNKVREESRRPKLGDFI